MEGFKQFSYNKVVKIVVVGVGFCLGFFYLVFWNVGKVMILVGNCLIVGIVGYVLGGGWGFSFCKFGLVMDNILEVQLVVVNGIVVIVNVQKNKDFYFVICGVGVMFYGIVIQFIFWVYDVFVLVIYFKYRWNDKVVLFKNFKLFQLWGLNVFVEIFVVFYMDLFGVSWLEGIYLGKKIFFLLLVKMFFVLVVLNFICVEEELNWI